MTQIPLLSGVYGNEAASFSHAYPKNLEPTAFDTKLSKGYLRSPMGATVLADAPGIDRGAINWNDNCYRVMGSKLIRMEMALPVELGDVGEGDYVAMDYSFDRLMVLSGGNMWFYDGTAVTQVTDPDLGTVIDGIWVDSYFMLTDGRYIIVNQLSDPYQFDPLKYGSADDDPDNVTGLLKIRGEVQVLGRYTVQPFRNVGGNGFPFQAIRGATIPKGCVGPAAKCLFGETFAFVGSGRNEALGIYQAGSGTATKLSTEQIDRELAKVADLTTIKLEQRVSGDEARLYVHLPDRSWVFMARSSQDVGAAVWYEVGSGSDQPYRIRNAVMAGGRTYCGDALAPRIGLIDTSVSSHFGIDTEWRFDVGLIYNQAKGGIVHDLELVGLPGRVEAGDKPIAFMSSSRDAGETWGMERATATGALGQRVIRVRWSPHSRFGLYVSYRFRGISKQMAGWAALEANLEPLDA